VSPPAFLFVSNRKVRRVSVQVVHPQVLVITLVPCVVLSKRFPIAVQVVLVAVGAVIAYQTAVLFFSFDLS
jgi:hypothetical protein